ncbi:hypothetical protein DFH09DRAFT_1454434 [Mycena vulgaris]|nr:hypothetical protein DFH09DRAFT_1454434 [Mycena vulgaris]
MLWLFALLTSRAVRADFHLLDCVSTGPSRIGIPSNPTIVVPASDMADCSGILGPRMVLLQNLTTPVASMPFNTFFSIPGLCGAPLLDVWMQTPDHSLLSVFIHAADGVRKGDCGTNLSPQNHSCSAQDLSLNCTDTWTCFTAICEAPRAGSVTSVVSASSLSAPPFTPSPSGTSAGTTPSAPVPVSPAANTAITAPRPTSNAPVILGSVLGAGCLGLGLAVAVLVRARSRSRRRDEGRGDRSESARPFQAFRAARPPLKSGALPVAPTMGARAEGSSAGASAGSSIEMGTRDAGAEAFPPKYSVAVSDRGGERTRRWLSWRE